MNPARVDLIVDLTFGLLIFVAVVLVVVGGSTIGIGFGAGVLVSYMVHVGWKMSRFDPDWMSRQVAGQVEEAVSEEIENTVEVTIGKEIDVAAKQVEETLTEEVSETVKKTVSEEMNDLN